MIRWKALIETKIKQKTASKNIQPFSSYSRLNFHCSPLLFYCVIHIHEYLMKAFSISKMNTILGFLVPKVLKMSKFVDPTRLFQKLRGLLFCKFQYVKIHLCETVSSMTSRLTRTETSDRNNSRNNGNFDLLFFFKYSSILMVYPIQA